MNTKSWTKLTSDDECMNFAKRLRVYNRIADGKLPPETKDFLIDNGFFAAPASITYHGNYEGGLFDHSFAVARFLEELTERNSLVWERPESPLIVGLFHDICKIDQWRKNDDGEWEPNPDIRLKGHGDKSVMVLSTLMRLTEEETLCIRYHMGAFTDKSEWDLYTHAVDLYPNVLWTHHADMMAAHIAKI